MSKLIGTNPNQVPSNADLGTAAFMDKKEFLLSKGSEMSAIDAVISNTALDVFVYDTTKDSDGGAWRKRTQHTSWYNEKLNTTTRGSRKEFPAVAVIVMEYASATGSSAMTIYDGDDPTLPMWMSCQVAGNTRWIRYNGTIRSVAALNGIILAGANGADLQDSLLSRMDLICDKLERHFDGGTHQIDSRGIVHRNSNFIITSNGAQNIVSRYVNDVAMTVLPNAPIDAATGLPTPTVVIATQSGVTVIQNNGSVRNLSGGVYGTVNAFGEYFVAKGSGDDLSVMRWDSTDTIINYTKGTYRFNGNPATGYHPFLYGNGGKILAVDHTKRIHHLTGVTGLTTWDIDGGVSDRNSLQNNIKTNFNTGWMVGNNKLAFLSDTDATDIAGTELLANNLIANVTNFASPGGTITWNSSGYADVTRGASDGPYVASHVLTTPLVTGKTYTVTANIVTNNGGGNGLVRFGSSTAYSQDTNIKTGTGILSTTFTATAEHTHVWLYSLPSNTTSFKEIYIRAGELDRSVASGRVGVQVFGTIKKTPVASGADLVAYSGFTSANGLVLPYTSDIEPGTSDYSLALWFKTDNTNAEQTLVRRFGNPTVTGGILLRVTGSQTLQWYTRDTSSNVAQISTTFTVDDGNWHQVIGTREGARMKLYFDGNLIQDVSTSANSHSAGATSRMHIGVENTTGASNPTVLSSFVNPSEATSITLVRWALSAPTAFQAKKMYEDERHLFAENAKCTLPTGSSDVVTALAYDNGTELLHVGTSAGRSDFHGLRRINNTTRAIGTAISAVDGFIVEE